MHDAMPRVAPPTGSALERFLAVGEDALSTSELLTLALGAGRRGGFSPVVADRLVATFGDVRRLAAAPPGELRARGGLGPYQATRLGAAFALGRRALASRLEIGRRLNRSDAIFEAFHARLRDLKKERFIAVLLDARQRVMREDLVSEGILTASLVHPREVFAPAIREGASGILLVHNHPSGDPEPSPEDIEITRRLVAVGELVGIRVLDHVVLGDASYVSFRERGML